MLVSALYNREKIIQIYEEAVEKSIGFSAMVMQCLLYNLIILLYSY